MRTETAQHTITAADHVEVTAEPGGGLRLDVTGGGSLLTIWVEDDNTARTIQFRIAKALHPASNPKVVPFRTSGGAA